MRYPNDKYKFMPVFFSAAILTVACLSGIRNSADAADFDTAWADVRDYGSLAGAVSGIGGTAKTLLIPDTQDVSEDVNVPASLTLQFLNGGKLNIAGSSSVTINGAVDAGLYQIFTGSGSVIFSSGAQSLFYPEWWYSGTGSWHTALESAASAAANSRIGAERTVVFSQLYHITSEVNWPGQVSIRGNGHGTGIRAHDCDGLKVGVSQEVGAWKFENFLIEGDTLSGCAIEFPGTPDWLARSWGVTIDQVHINCFDTGIRMRSVWQSQILNCNLTVVWHGIEIVGKCATILVNNCKISKDYRTGAGNSKGIYVDSTDDYDPDGSTSQNPEAVSITETVCFGFEYGIDWQRCLVGHIINCDLDEITGSGIRFQQTDGGLSVSGGWIYILGPNARYGIESTAMSADDDNIAIFDHIRISAATDAAPDSSGITLLLNQNNNTVKNCWLSGFKGQDIQVYGNKGNKILYNQCQSDANYSIYISETDGSTVLQGNNCAAPVVLNSDTLGSELEQATLDSASFPRATSDINETDLYSTVIRADTLQKIGSDTRGYRGIHIMASGSMTGSKGKKTIKLYFGSQSVTVFPPANNKRSWLLEAWIIVKSAAQPVQSIAWQFNDGKYVKMGQSESFNADMSGDVSVKITGQCFKPTDVITQNLWLVERF